MVESIGSVPKKSSEPGRLNGCSATSAQRLAKGGAIIYLSCSRSKTHTFHYQFVSISPDISAQKLAAQPRAALDMLGYSRDVKSTFAAAVTRVFITSRCLYKLCSFEGCDWARPVPQVEASIPRDAATDRSIEVEFFLFEKISHDEPEASSPVDR